MVVGRQFYIFRAITEKLRSPNLNGGTISFNVWPWWVYMSWIYIGASPNNDLWDSSNIFNTILFITSSQWRLVRMSSRWLCLYFYYFYLYIISIVIFFTFYIRIYISLGCLTHGSAGHCWVCLLRPQYGSQHLADSASWSFDAKFYFLPITYLWI